MNFRTALVRAGQKADLGWREMTLIRRVSFCPAKLADLQAEVSEQAVAEGIVAAGAATIDWEALLDFIIKLMPVILELIRTLLDMF